MKNLSTLIIALFIWSNTNAQIDTFMQLLSLKDGTKLYGHIKEDLPDTLYFLSSLLGDLAIPRSKIYGLFRQSNLMTPAKIAIYNDRYFVCESAYGLRAKSSYFSSAEIYINKAAYGINDNISIESGTTFGTNFEGGIIYAGGKFSKPINNNLRIAYRFLLGKKLDQGDQLQFRHEAIVTYGSITSNISVSYYYHKGKDQYEETNLRSRFLSISGRHQFTKSLSFVIENIFANKSLFFANIGISKDYLDTSWSIGLTSIGYISELSNYSRITLPYIGVKIPIN